MISIVRSSLHLTLPWAPSVNNYWKPFMRPGMSWPMLRLTPGARYYRGAAIVALRKITGATKYEAWKQPVRIDIELRPPDRRKRDIDNNLKPILDSLTFAGVWDDDSRVDEMTVSRGRVIDGGSVSIIVTALDQP